MSDKKLLRDFTRNDWCGLAGAEPPAPGVEPKVSHDMTVADWPQADAESIGETDIHDNLTICVDKYGIGVYGASLYFDKEHGGFKAGCAIAEHLLNLEQAPTMGDLIADYGFEMYDPYEYVSLDDLHR